MIENVKGHTSCSSGALNMYMYVCRVGRHHLNDTLSLVCGHHNSCKMWGKNKTPMTLALHTVSHTHSAVSQVTPGSLSGAAVWNNPLLSIGVIKIFNKLTGKICWVHPMGFLSSMIMCSQPLIKSSEPLVAELCCVARKALCAVLTPLLCGRLSHNALTEYEDHKVMLQCERSGDTHSYYYLIMFNNLLF